MIKSLQLSNFRSYENIRVDLSPNINVFIGKNGQGKTNLLEAIHFISNIRSHRSKDDTDLIKHNEEYSRIIVEKAQGEKIVCVIFDKGKYFSINDNVVKTTSEMLGKINTVLFYPTETRLFSDSPSVRRTFFDVEIGKVSKTYTSDFQKFNNALKERNKLLKSDNVDHMLLDIFTDQISEIQVNIIKHREYLIKFINHHVTKYLANLISDDLKITIEYKSNLKNLTYEQIKTKYKDNERRDLFNKVTSEGVHRDDYIIYSNNIEVDKILSQGQIRITLLAIKLVLVEYIYYMSKSLPVLLLDDVLSELDIENQKNLLRSIPSNVQTIITTTDDYDIFENNQVKKFLIEKSKIINEEEFNVRY